MWTAQKLLETLAAAPDGIALVTLSDNIDTATGNIVNAMQVLRRRGLATIDRPGHYRITPAGTQYLADNAVIRSGSTVPKQRKTSVGLRKRAWWVMRKRRKFSVPSLLSAIASGDERSAYNNIGKYVKALERSGILLELPKRGPGQYKYWLLVADPGPKAPVWRQKERAIYDPNSDTLLPLEKPHEVAS